MKSDKDKFTLKLIDIAYDVIKEGKSVKTYSIEEDGKVVHMTVGLRIEDA